MAREYRIHVCPDGSHGGVSYRCMCDADEAESVTAIDSRDVEPLVSAARSVSEAHRLVIVAVTPGHADALPPGPMEGEKREQYDARFSHWHATTRELRAALQPFTPENNDPRESA